MFEPLHTERLLLRAPRIADAEALHARRNDPDVAALQSWPTPFPRERADALVAAAAEAGGPSDDTWWMITVADRDDSVIFGDVALKLMWHGRAAEIGYTFAREHQGKGYATEAVEAVLDHLFSRPELTRVCATLHPDNHPSSALLERTGFRFEGHTRLSFWVGDENSDDWLYGLTRADRDDWRSRPTDPPRDLRLVEVDESNQYEVRRLAVHHSQNRFASPVIASFADAQFPEIVDGAPVVPWMRAVEADGELAAFVMLALITEAHPEPFLWRLLVDRRHQHRGIGRRILDLVVDEVRGAGATSLLTSWVEGHGSPRPFYERYGFVPTGEVIDGETEGRLLLD